MIQNPKLRRVIDVALHNFKGEGLPDNWRDFGSARLRMDSGKFLTNILYGIKPKYSLEFGSGASTLAMSKNVRVMHYAYEHVHKYWEQTVTSLVRTHDASVGYGIKKATVYLRALDENYMYPILPGDLPRGIEVVLIDGPPLRAPKDGKPRDRFRTLPSLMEYLHQDAIVLLDNTERESEQGILEAWKDELGIEYETHDEVRGLGIIDPWGYSV